MTPALVRIYFWTPKSHRYNQTLVRFKSDPLAAFSFRAALGTKKQQEGQIWIGLNQTPALGHTNDCWQWAPDNVTGPRFSRQPATSQLHHQISMFTRPHQHTPPEKHQPRNRSCDECGYTTSSGYLSRRKFEIHQKRRHSCEYGKSIASKYDLSQHIYLDHDNCPIICKICSKPFNNRHKFATHKLRTDTYISWFVLNQYGLIHMAKHA